MKDDVDLGRQRAIELAEEYLRNNYEAPLARAALRAFRERESMRRDVMRTRAENRVLRAKLEHFTARLKGLLARIPDGL